MSRGIYLVCCAVVLGVLVCLFEGLLANWLFRDDNTDFWGSVIAGASSRELFGRVILVLCFVAFGVIAALVDTRRGRSESALRESETRFRALFEHITGGVAVYEAIDGGEDFVVRDLNRAGERICGVERKKVLGKHVTVAFPSVREFGLFEVLQRVWRTGRPEHYAVAHYRDARTSFWADNYVYRLPTGEVVAVFDDVTERMRAEEHRRLLEAQVQHAQKLESLGMLAGGIAHDFNNLLMGILGNADLALSDMSLASKARRHLKEIETTSRRAAELCLQMLTYSGKGPMAALAVDLSELVRDMTPLLKASISKKVTLDVSVERDLSLLEGDPTQIRQVILNLITNASDAIGGGDGTISISTHSIACNNDWLKTTYLNEGLSEGHYVCLDVSDSGCGMDQETQDRIFDPFYTTKSSGHGLGLAVVIGIVRRHGGAIKVHSEPGNGTLFRILFPASTRLLRVPEKTVTTEPPWHGKGCVLVVDDDEKVRELARHMLERNGFLVLSAKDGEEGVTAFREHCKEIDLVLLDMTMPRMDGAEAFREMMQIRADIPVVVSSGYTEQETMGRFRENGIVWFLQKPYQTKDLLRMLRTVLESPAGMRAGERTERT